MKIGVLRDGLTTGCFFSRDNAGSAGCAVLFLLRPRDNSAGLIAGLLLRPPGGPLAVARSSV